MGTNAQPKYFKPGVERRFLSTWNARGTRPLPTSAQQASAIYGLNAYFGHLAVRREAVVNGEEAVQDEIQVQLMEVLNLYAQVRYILYLFSASDGSNLSCRLDILIP